MGGRAATQDFFRLFVLPGMGHCSGGDGAFAVDYLSYLEDWVEAGKAPTEIMSFHVRNEDLLSGMREGRINFEKEWKKRLRFPLDPMFIGFSRPVFPYPTKAKYRGHGDPNLAKSFMPVEP
jgi:feruloyl esterase